MELLQDYSDEKIAILARTRNPEFFADLITRYQQRIFGFVLSIVRHPQTAEDITQTSFEKAFVALNSFQVNRSFKTWLFTIAKNQAYTFLRQQKRQGQYVDPSAETNLKEPASEQANPQEEIIQSQEQAELKRALAKLKPKYQMVLRLYYLEDSSYQEIADILQLKVNTVRTHIRRAKQALARTLNKKI